MRKLGVSEVADRAGNSADTVTVRSINDECRAAMKKFIGKNQTLKN